MTATWTLVAIALASAAIPAPSGVEVRGSEDLPIHVGQRVCLECHGPGATGAACSVGSVEEHRRSFQALAKPEAAHIAVLTGVAEPPQRSQLCLGCHATAPEEGPRWTGPDFAISDGVQCEACHGAGSVHVEIMKARPAARVPSGPERLAALGPPKRAEEGAFEQAIQRTAARVTDARTKRAAERAEVQRDGEASERLVRRKTRRLAEGREGGVVGMTPVPAVRWAADQAEATADERGAVRPDGGRERVNAERAGAGVAGGAGDAMLAIAPKEELCESCHKPRASHRDVLELGYRRPETDRQYKTPVNLAVSPSGDRLFVACERSDSLIVIDTARRRVVSEIQLQGRPHGVAVHPDGQTVYVTSRLASTLTAIDAASGKVLARAPVVAEPHGVKVDAAGERLFVLGTGEDAISVLGARDLKETARLPAGPGPWALAFGPDGGTAYVTNHQPSPAAFREPHHSEVTIVGSRPPRVLRRVRVAEANVLQGIARVPGRDVMLFTLMRTKNLVPMSRLAQGWVITNGIGVLWPDGRVDQVLLDDPADAFPDPTDIAVAPGGRTAIVTSAGSDRVGILDVDALLRLLAGSSDDHRERILPNRLGTSARFLVERLPVGRNPRGVAFSPDGRFAYVAAAMSDAVTIIDMEGLTVAGEIDLGGPAAITELRRGERLFNSAASTFGRQFSCRSCHPEGHLNGLTFDIEADGIGLKPVDNRTLRGIADTPPFKWDGTNPTLSRQCGPRLAVFFTRLDPLSPPDLAALVRFVGTIEEPPNPHRPAGGLTPQQRRGKLIFDRKVDNLGRPIPPEQRCINCHNGGYKTSLKGSRVGTDMWFDAEAPDMDRVDLVEEDALGPLGIVYFSQDFDRVRTLDAPHLRGIHRSAPYLHNGGAATLEEIWTRFNLYDWHGVTGDLTRGQFNDLIAYLKTL